MKRLWTWFTTDRFAYVDLAGMGCIFAVLRAVFG